MLKYIEFLGAFASDKEGGCHGNPLPLAITLGGNCAENTAPLAAGRMAMPSPEVISKSPCGVGIFTPKALNDDLGVIAIY